MARAATILILGGYGETGRRLAGHLLERTDARLVVAGRGGPKADALAVALNRSHPGDRVSALALDATDQAALRRALSGVQLVIVATPALKGIGSVAEAVLESRADWLDVQYAPRQAAVLESLEQRMLEAGLCFVTQGGFHPGVPAALVRWAAAQVDALESAVVSGFLNQQGGLPYTSGVDELIESFRGWSAHFYRHGRWQRVSGWWPSDYRPADFDFGIGRRRTFPVDLDEMKPLPTMIPSLRRTGFGIAGLDLVTNWVVTPLIMVGLGLAPRVKLEAWGRLLCWSSRVFAGPPYAVVVQLDAEGRAAGRHVRLHLALRHDDGYELTAIPVVSMVRQMLDGAVRKPGLHRMALLAEPGVLLADCEAMGVEVRRRVTPLGMAL